MRAGDLGGLNEIYDVDGALILNKGERLLLKSAEDNIDLWKGKHGLLSRTLVARTKEKGTLYLTDKRLVFIRTPDPWLYYKTYGTPLGLSEGIPGAMKARDLRKLGLRVFAEIPYREVIAFKSHKKGKWIELRLEDQDRVPVRADINRLGKDDGKISLLEEMLLKAGARKLD